jgi:hypothetical protein
LRSGISYREFSELSKIAFVDVALRDYGIRGRPTNVSRVTAMTGIGRKDVRRVRELSTQYAGDQRVAFSPLSDVLHHWYTDPRFLDSNGLPRPLPAHDGPDSFMNLVKACAGDVPVGAIKVELIRCGAVAEAPDGYLRPLRRYVVPEAFDEKLINSLAFALRGLASTIAYNTNPNRTDEARIERVVHSDPIDSTAKQAISHVLRERLVAFTEDIDNLFSRIEPCSDPTERIGVGVYYYEDDK